MARIGLLGIMRAFFFERRRPRGFADRRAAYHGHAGPPPPYYGQDSAFGLLPWSADYSPSRRFIFALTKSITLGDADFD